MADKTRRLESSASLATRDYSGISSTAPVSRSGPEKEQLRLKHILPSYLIQIFTLYIFLCMLYRDPKYYLCTEVSTISL